MDIPYSFKLKPDQNDRTIEKIETVSGKIVNW